MIRIATFNVNSLRSRLAIVADWCERQKPSILCLQETKVQDSQFPLTDVEALGYSVAFRGQKSYNGVAILSKKPADETIYGFTDGMEPISESRLISCRFNDLWVVNSYVPQGKSIDHPDYEYKKSFLRRMNDHITKLGEQVLWCGDLNVAPTPIDVANPKTKTKHVCYYKELRDLFAEVTEEYVDLFRKYTGEKEVYSFFDYRVKDSLDRNIGWRIDHMLATKKLAPKCTNCTVDHEPRRAEKPSDHTPLFGDFDLSL